MVTNIRFFSRLWIIGLIIVSMTSLAILATGCGSDEEDTGPAGEGVLEVIGSGGTKTFTLEQIKALEATEGYWGIKTSTGRIIPPVMTRGVLLETLFAEVGGLPKDMAVGIVAKDGYEMTVSVTQLDSGGFITYDMVTGEENRVEGPLQVIVAYEYDGKPFDPESDGPLRLTIVSPKMNQVTDGHWSVKWVSKLELKTVELEWTLTLKGELTEEMDRGTFETGAARGCHGVDWTDADGNVWTGIALYLLVGRVDDENVHEGPAYNRDLANAGYQVRLSNAAGASTEVASGAMYYNKALIVAYKLNGEALPEEYWPLRLVGEGIEPGQMIGQITEIEALLPAE